MIETNEIVEETLEEAQAPAAKGVNQMPQEVSEPESIASVDKAAGDATSKASLPKTKAGMINAMYKVNLNKMKKGRPTWLPTTKMMEEY